MDKVILKFLKKEIEYFFKDFRQEDLNTNLFKGNVELSNLHLNNDVLQDALATVIPYVQVESATVEKFKLKVPFSSLKTKPTEVWISRIDVKCSEPINFIEFQNSLNKSEERKQKEVVKTGKYEYTLVDRILDGLQVTIDHIHVTTSLLGNFKHAKPGQWSPHVVDVNIYDVQVYSVDESWKRVGLQETRAYTHGKPYVWHFKESTCRLSIRLIPPRDASGASIPMDPVPLLDRLPVKFRLSQQRLNVNETIATEMTLLIGEAKMSFTPYQLGHLMYWIDSLSSAAFRRDLKKDPTKPAEVVVVPKPNTLFTVVLDKLNIQFRDRDKPTAKNIEFEINDLQVNRILQTSKPGETITRILLSQILLRNVKQDTILMQLYFTDPKETQGKHLYIPIPEEARLHPERVPESAVIRYSQLITVRYPEPAPPTPAFEYTVNTDGFQLVMERDGMENVAIFVLQANLINANRAKPTEEDYKGSTETDELKDDAPGESQPDGVEFFELDLLASNTALISLDCKIRETCFKVPTPGGGERPYLELRFDGVTLLGSPVTAPAVYKRDFLELKSQNGTCLVMSHDFYYQKFNVEKGVTPIEYTFKFNATIQCLSINMYEKDGATKESICSINNISSFCKIYSRARHIPNRLTIPQVESSIVASEVSVRLVQKHHHMLVDFLSEHFLYGATSLVKQMLEQEIKGLAVEERKFARAQEDPTKKKKFLLLPSYMVSSAIDKLTVVFIDDNKRDVLSLNVVATECILEKHDDRQIIIARIGDLRLFSLFPEIENSIIWVQKKNLKNLVQIRTEWRKLYEGNPLFNKSSSVGIPSLNDVSTRSFILGDAEGLRFNFDLRNIYNIQDYLADVLGESIILIDKTQHSHFWWKIGRYIEILYVAGIPSEANNYWRNLREIKLFLEQYSDLFDDITWDLSVSDVRVSFGDDLIQVEPFSMEQFRVVRDQQDEKDHVQWSLKQVKGSLWVTEKDQKIEHVICLPVDTVWDYQRENNANWNPKSDISVPQYFQKVHFESKPNPQIIIQPEHFHNLALLKERHMPQLVKFLNDLMTHADTGEQRRGTRSGVIFDEDVLDEARGSATRAYSPDTVKAMRRDLEHSKQELEDAIIVQTDIAGKYAELQMQHHDLTKKYEDMEKRANGYEQAMMEMQSKMMELQLKLANVK